MFAWRIQSRFWPKPIATNKDMRLAGKSLVVIGGTTGLGLSAAKAFLQEGAKVVVVGRSEEKVIAIQTELNSAHVKALVGDACEPNTATRAIENALQEFGRF